MIEGLVQHDTEMRNADDRLALTPFVTLHEIRRMWRISRVCCT
jgi:hypothetical protein